MPRPARIALLAALFAGCGGAAPVSPSPPPPSQAPRSQDGPAPAASPTFTLTDQDIEAVVRTDSAARQLPSMRPIPIERLDRKSFAERLLRGSGGPSSMTGLNQDSAFLLGFDFVPQPDKRRGISSMNEVLKEQVVGFYDVAAAKVFIPDVRLKSKEDLLQQRAVLAHEIQHALQAQHFPKAPRPRSSDEALAQLALIEGDAQVAMGAWLGAEAGAPVGRTLRRIAEVTKRVPLSNVTRGEESRALDKALALTRRRLAFPYEEGMLFVSDVYRAGGFPLIDKMYARPPRSTEQVLHPEKYLAGEDPRPIADLQPPRGYQRVAAGTMGELDIRVLLDRCLGREAAERAAAGWAGDRYAVLAGPDHHLATAWITAWDTEQDADEAEQALRSSASCWHDNALGLGQGDFTIGSGIAVRRRRKLVAFIRGLPPAAHAAVEPQLFGLVGPEPAPVPLSDLKIPPRVRLPEPSPGRLMGDVYQNDWLGVVGRVPQGMTARVGSGLDFVVERPDVLVRGALTVSTRITSDAENEKTFREVQEGFVAEASQLSMSVEVLGGGPVRTSLGSGVERTWRVAGTRVEMRMILLPICAGTGSVVFVQAYSDSYARSVLDGWLASFRWIKGRNITACDFLDPK